MTDLEFIQSPMEWPRWPVLPLVKLNDARFTCGMLLAGEPVVYVGIYMFDTPDIADKLRAEGNEHPTWRDVLKGAKRIEYVSYEDVLKEWRID